MNVIQMSAKELKGLLDGEPYSSLKLKVVVDYISSTSRWSIYHDLIFEFEGKYYRTSYSVGATEYQDEQPFENEDTVECVQVKPYPVTTVEFRDV